MTIRMNFPFIYIAVFIFALNNVETYQLYSRVDDMMSNYTNFTWKDCGGPTIPLHFLSFSLSPYPLIVPGYLTMNTTVSLTTALPSDLNVTLAVEWKFDGSYIKWPCINDVGSCAYSDACSRWTKICPKDFGENNVPCSCPIPPNNYTVNNIPIFINATHSSPFTEDFRVTGILSSPSIGPIGCVQFSATIIDKGH